MCARTREALRGGGPYPRTLWCSYDPTFLGAGASALASTATMRAAAAEEAAAVAAEAACGDEKLGAFLQSLVETDQRLPTPKLPKVGGWVGR